MFDFFAGHALPCLQQNHILFKTRNIQLQRFKGHRQGLIAKIEILSGILGIVGQHATPNAAQITTHWHRRRK